MTFGNNPLNFTCPDPVRCPVAYVSLEQFARAGDLRLVTYPHDRAWYRVFNLAYGFASPNPGFGDTRFAPFNVTAGSTIRVPTLYLAETLEAAMLETDFHDVHLQKPRVVYEATLLQKAFIRLLPPASFAVVDLRDSTLQRLGLEREQLSSSSPEHYPCTRKVARMLYQQFPQAAGIVWHSRQTELSQLGNAEVAVVFADRITADDTQWQQDRYRNAASMLTNGPGRQRFTQLAQKLGVKIERQLPKFRGLR